MGVSLPAVAPSGIVFIYTNELDRIAHDICIMKQFTTCALFNMKNVYKVIKRVN